MNHAVAIIGMGAKFPGAADLPAFRQAVMSGSVQSGPIPRQRWDHRTVHSSNPRAANKTSASKAALMEGIDLFAPEFFGITPRRATIMDPQQRLMLEISRQALEDAGYADRVLAGRNVGVFIGASSSDHRSWVCNPVTIGLDLAGRSGQAPRLTPEEFAAVTAALPPVQAYTIVGQQLNMIAANVSQAFDFTGPAFSIDTACSSALAALHEAILNLRGGTIGAAIVGGVYVCLDPTMMVCFSRIGALSPSDSCRPFTADADGFVLGEGVGAIVLKRLEDAERDGDRILGVIRGIAMNNDGRAEGPLTPSSVGQRAAIAAAWADAGLEPGSVGLLEAHATGTKAGDASELAALNAIFGGHVPEAVPITSIKANFGHGLSSAGIASLLKACLAVDEGFIPPHPATGELREEFTEYGKVLRVPRQPEPWNSRDGGLRRAGVSAFGFGGTNVHVVLEQAPVRVPATRSDSPRRFEVSAPNTALLSEYLRKIQAEQLAHPRPLADVAFTLSHRRRDRLAVSFHASTFPEFNAELTRVRSAIEAGQFPITNLGASDKGSLISLSPSPLPLRPFWLVDEKKRSELQAPAAVTLEAPAEKIVATDRLQLVRSAVCAVTAWQPNEVHPHQKLMGDLGFDSLTTLEFMTVLGRSLPGVNPPPRQLFSASLTVADLVDYLAQSAPALSVLAEVPTLTFETLERPWLLEHRPTGRALLPLAGLIEAVLEALKDESDARVMISDFDLLLPVEVESDSLALVVGLEANNAFSVHVAGNHLTVAEGHFHKGAVRGSALEHGVVETGSLPLRRFYAEFGFHGPSLQSIAETPQVASWGAVGWIEGHDDAVLILDGALQLALYWLAQNRHQSAVATGFSELRLWARFPAEGRIRCVARLTGEQSGEFTGDFDFFTASDELLAQWRGVRGRTLSDAAKSVGGPENWPEVRQLAAQKAALEHAGLAMPYFASHEGIAGATTRIGGGEYLNFSSYNYLGLSGDATVTAAATEAMARYGTSASASRVASGERPLHAELEKSIARFLGCEAALSLVSGHATNVSLIGHLFGPEDLIIHDSLAHDCILSGARLSGARRLAFPHNDVVALEALLSRERARARRTLIAVEGVYSMDGDLAPLAEIVDLKRRYDCLLLVDEAHSIGVIGSTGRGAGEHFGLAPKDVDFWMGTLSKALASCGGYIAGSAAMIDYLRFTLPGFVYSVGLSPANAGAALAALQILDSKPALPRRLQARSNFFRNKCRELGLDVGASAHAAIVPCLTGSSVGALRLAQALKTAGINVQPIFHPTVEEGKARLRFFVTEGHTEAQLALTASAIAHAWAEIKGTLTEAKP